MKIIVFNDSASFIGPECVIAFRNLGHKVKTISLERDPGNPGQTFPYNIVKRVEDILSFMPDLLLMINGNGIDNKGLIPRIAAILKIPLALWYLDRPDTLENWDSAYIAPTSSIYVTDRTYVNELKNIGLKKVCFLPLATNPERFNVTGELYRDKLMDVVFVGKLDRDKAFTYFSSLKDKWDNKPEDMDNLFWKIVHAYRKRPELTPELITKNIFQDFGYSLEYPSEEIRNLLFNAIEYMANVYNRTEFVKELRPFNISVCGSWEWLDVVDKRHYINEVNYFSGLASIYKNAIINLNISRLQLKTAVNQRLFNVPSAGGFLLTDYREDVEEFFEIGKEVICFRNMEELKGYIRYYLSHPDERGKVVSAAREKVLMNHTYEIRMAELIKNINYSFSDSEYSEEINRVIRIDPVYIEALNLLGAAAWEINQTDLSGEFFRLGLVLAPYNAGGKKGIEIINRITGYKKTGKLATA